MKYDRILSIGWASQRDGERAIISGKCKITKTTDQNRGSALQVSIIRGQIPDYQRKKLFCEC